MCPDVWLWFDWAKAPVWHYRCVSQCDCVRRTPPHFFKDLLRYRLWATQTSGRCVVWPAASLLPAPKVPRWFFQSLPALHWPERNGIYWSAMVASILIFLLDILSPEAGTMSSESVIGFLENSSKSSSPHHLRNSVYGVGETAAWAGKSPGLGKNSCSVSSSVSRSLCLMMKVMITQRGLTALGPSLGEKRLAQIAIIRFHDRRALNWIQRFYESNLIWSRTLYREKNLQIEFDTEMYNVSYAMLYA